MKDSALFLGLGLYIHDVTFSGMIINGKRLNLINVYCKGVCIMTIDPNTLVFLKAYSTNYTNYYSISEQTCF